MQGLSARAGLLLCLIWSEVELQPRRASFTAGPPGWGCSRVPLVSLHPRTCIPSWTLKPPHHRSCPHPHSPVLCSQLPGLFLGSRFISTPAGIPSCHSGPPEPLWNAAWEWKCTSLMQELILVTFSRQTCTALWCIAVDARRGIKITWKQASL